MHLEYRTQGNTALVPLMRVAFCTHYPISAILSDGDSSRTGEHPFPWVRLLARALIDRGHVQSLHVITHTNRHPEDRVIERDGITFHLFAYHDRLDLASVRMRGFRVAWGRALWRQVRCLRKLAPDVIHAHGTDDVHGLTAILSGQPYVLSLQGLMAQIERVQPTSRTRDLQRLEWLALKRARVINAKTPGMAAYARKLNRRAQVYEIEDAIAPEYFAAAIPRAAPVLHFVGALTPRKGVEQWIDAFASLSMRHVDLRGRIVGKGPAAYQKFLRQRIQTAGLEKRLVLTGPLNATEIAQGFAEDGGVFCLPSRAEHCPNAVMEAMAAGLPVVATRIGDVHHLVEAEASGLLVGAPDPLLVDEAISRLLAAPQWAERLGQRGREIATSRWQVDRCAELHAELYHEVLSSPRRRRH